MIRRLVLALIFVSAAMVVAAESFEGLAARTLEHVENSGTLTVVLIAPTAENTDLEPPFLAWIEDQIAATLMARRTAVTVLARRELDLISREREVQQSALYDPQQRAQFGQAVGANTFGFIDLVDWGDRYLVYLELVRASTGELLSAERAAIRKTMLPGRFVDLSGIRIDQLGDPAAFQRGIEGLVDPALVTEFSGRRVALAEVRAHHIGAELQRAAVREYHVALFRRRGPGTQLLIRDTEELLLDALTREIESTTDPRQMAQLAPRFQGADVLSVMTLEADPARGDVSLSMRHIDAGRGAYLPGAASTVVPLRVIYQPLYIPADYLLVTSDPPGVPVRVSGIEYGGTPAYIFDLPPGEHTIEIGGVAPYGVSRQTARFVRGSGEQRVSVTLQRPRVRMRIVDADTGRPVTNATVQSRTSAVQRNDEYVFSGVATGPEEVLVVEISAEGYLASREELQLHTRLPVEHEWVIRLLQAREQTLSFITEPEGAMVFLDNQFIGRAPQRNIRIDAAGSTVPLRIQAPGWNTINQDLDLRDLGTGGVASFVLTRDVWLQSTPPGAEVLLNGEPLGRTNMQVPMPAGQNTLEFKLGSFERAVTFDPATDDAREVSVTVTRQRAAIPVRIVTPVRDVEVWVDNERAELRDGQVILPEGPQRVRFARAGYAPEVRYLDVRTGLMVHLDLLTLEESGRLAEVRSQISAGRGAREEEALLAMHEANPRSPHIATTLLDLYLVEMQRVSARLIPGQRELTRLARAFASLDTRLQFSDPRWRAVHLYQRGRYADILAESSVGVAEHYGQAITGYTAFIEMYRQTEGLYLDTPETRSRFDNAHFRRAVLAARQYLDVYRGSASAEQQREAVERYLQAYLQVPLPDKSPERLQQVRQLLVQVRE